VISRRFLPLLGAVVAIGVIAIALASGLGADKVETGVVVVVDAQGLTDVRAFTLRTPDGRTIEFRVGRLQNAAQFPPAHLSVHLQDSIPVRVTYELSADGSERIAVRLEDAPGAP
jgi:hypothetical protein